MKANKIDPDKITFATYYEAFKLSKMKKSPDYKLKQENIITRFSSEPDYG